MLISHDSHAQVAIGPRQHTPEFLHLLAFPPANLFGNPLVVLCPFICNKLYLHNGFAITRAVMSAEQRARAPLWGWS